MNGKARGPVGPLAGWMFLLAVVTGCQAGEGSSGGCEGLCEHLGSVECAEGSVDDCIIECQEFELDLPVECRAAWGNLRDCMAEASLLCEPGDCIPSTEGEECPTELEIQGCDDEAAAFQSCDGGDCSDEAGGGRFVTEDGRSVDYGLSSECGECEMPPAPGAAPGFPCASSGDCASLCCACGDRDISVEVCIDGVCASESDACSDSLGLCD